MDGNTEAPLAGRAMEPREPVPHDPAAPSERATISRIVAEVAAQFPGERITLGEMCQAFGDRAFGLLILLLLLPGLLPGMASVFGTPVLILGIQMGLGMRSPRFPRFIARQGVKREDLLRLASASSTWLAKVERWVKPRPGPFTGPVADRVVGWLSAYTALMLILPGPGTNGPPAFGNIVMALGVVENDSKVIGIGMALTVLGNLFATAVIVAIFWLGVQAVHWLV